VLARHLHAHSGRASRPFVAVELAGLGEGELAGEAERAPGGTLFLDEVGDAPLPLQARLLRLVHDGNARIIVATRRNLRERVACGAFREDLYYRLKVIELEVPPLRARRDDVRPLAELFLARVAERSRRPLRSFSPEALAILERHAWPGNVRELRNSIERAAVLADGEVLGAELFGAETESLVDASRDDPAGDSLSSAERRHIARVIAKYPTMEEAARALGIDVVTLWRRRRKYRLD
jgi:DNA-binding NtrC family response regulator